jgi:hypothetical protein
MTFVAGVVTNPNGRPKGREDNRTIARRERLKALSRKIGRVATAHELLKSIYEDPDAPLEMRKDAARDAIRFETPALSITNDPALLELIKPAGRGKVDLSRLTNEKRAMLAGLVAEAMEQGPPTLELAALPAPVDRPASLPLSPTARAEREAMFREAEAIMSAEELAQLKREFPLD